VIRDAQNRDARRAWRLVLAQLTTTVVIFLLASLYDLHTARDVSIGGLAATLGSALLAAWVFVPYRAQRPGRIVARFYSGELIRMLGIVVVFGLAMWGLDDLNPVALMGAFLLVQVLPPLLANRIAR
jgi:F0F1-type ATP synthase assembly protein I